jgi:site-specific recombinase XerC
LSASSVNIAVSAVRFLYAVTLGRETLDLMASVPHMKRATRRAEVYARSEVEAILTAPRQPRDRVLLMTVYGCGLRISEANMSGNTVILGLALAQLESGSVPRSARKAASPLLQVPDTPDLFDLLSDEGLTPETWVNRRH